MTEQTEPTPTTAPSTVAATKPSETSVFASGNEEKLRSDMGRIFDAHETKGADNDLKMPLPPGAKLGSTEAPDAMFEWSELSQKDRRFYSDASRAADDARKSAELFGLSVEAAEAAKTRHAIEEQNRLLQTQHENYERSNLAA